MKINPYILQQDKAYVKILLKYLEHDVSNFTEEIKTDIQYLEKYKFKELFLKIISKFNPDLHLPHSKKLFLKYLSDWNNKYPDRIINETELIDKYYFIVSNEYGIINPYLLRKSDKTNNILQFFETIEKKYMYYPFFLGAHIDETVKEMEYGESFKLIDLINDNENIFEAIFHNYKGLGDLFKETLTEYLISINYADWEKDLNRYYFLLMSLSSMELNLNEVINTLGTYKRDQLKKLAINILKNKTEILKFEKPNFLSRLHYAVYEIEGINIYNPPEGSSLVPFVEDTEKEKNIFKQIETIDRWIDNNFENRNLFRDLLKDVEFILWNFGNEISLAEWTEIYKSCNSVFYRLKYFLVTSKKKDKWTELNSMDFIPYIIIQLLNTSTNLNLLKESEVNINEIKFRIIKYFIDSIFDSKERELGLLLDLYLFMPASPSKLISDYQYEAKENLRNYIIELLSGIKSKNVYDIIFNKIKEQIDISHDFSIFDILKNYWEYADELKNLIINHYYKIIEEETITNHFFTISGKDNLFKAISVLNDGELSAFLDKYDFVPYFENNTQSTSDLFNEGAKLRFHLGILTEYSLSEDNHRDEIINYVLRSYKNIIKIKSDIIEPLNWDKIISDTFLFNYNFSEKQLLSILIIDLLIYKDNSYVTVYFNDIKDYLSFTELSFYQKKFPDIEEIMNHDLDLSFPKELHGTGLGRAQIEAQLLLKYNFPDKAIKYVDYIESLSKEYLSNNIKEIKFRAFLLLNNFNKAEETLESISADTDNLRGLLYYFNGDFPNAVQCFERYKIRTLSLGKGDIINYSASLIKNNQQKEAIKLLEENKEKYSNEYLIFLNLGVAYKNIDDIKALNYFLVAKDLSFGVTDTKFAVYESMIDLIPEFAKINSEFSENPSATSELINKFHNNSIKVIRETSTYNIDETEKIIVQEIFYAIEQKRLGAYRLANYSENEMSDELKYVMQASLKHKNIIVERESPAGFSIKKSGEIDFYIYSNDTNIIFAVGENKEWSPQKFENQLKQLLGYAKANRGFCFTIIFNKKGKISNILTEREEIISSFKVEDNGKNYFEMINKVPDASIFIDGIKDVFLSFHKNPEDSSTLRIYHFIIDADENERKISAKQARSK